LILIVSNVAHESAKDLAGLFPTGAASVITASDLNQSFRAAVSVGAFPASRITIDGKTTPASRIAGVVSTISHFLPQEFYYIEPADRLYVCAEVSAFFIYFLSELRCPKLNPPSTKTISGLGLHPIGWLRAAQAHGVPVWPLHLRNERALEVADSAGLAFARVTLVGGCPVEGDAPERLVDHMRVLARVFAMPYLRGVFAARPGEDHRLTQLHSVPDVSDPLCRRAMARFFDRGESP
jgi:hypothetical protein